MTQAKAGENVDAPAADEKRPRKPLTPEAERALAEAAERRKQRDAAGTERPTEKGGRKGPEPIRYGDWEKDGIVSDF